MLTALILIILTILGLGAGSYATMGVYRLPKGERWIGEGPICRLCRHRLAFRDFCPVISYFRLKGVCRYCHGEYPVRWIYFLTEFLITCGFIIHYFYYGLSEAYILATGFWIYTVVVTMIEWEQAKIPPTLLIVLTMIAMVYRVHDEYSLYGIFYGGALASLAALVLRDLYFRLQGDTMTGRDFLAFTDANRFAGPGFDYVKVTTIAGIWLGPSHLHWLLAVCLILGILAWLNKRYKLGRHLPWASLILWATLAMTAYQYAY